MTRPITSDLVEAYSLCPRKAFLMWTGVAADPGPHDYEVLIRELADTSRQSHHVRLAEKSKVVPFTGPADLAVGKAVLADAVLSADNLQARCDFLVKATGPSRPNKPVYEPVQATGTSRVSKTDILGLAFAGMVLGEVQGSLPSAGTLVQLGGQPRKVNLAGKYREVRKIVEALRPLQADPTGIGPPLVLNKHCPGCPFRDTCLKQAEKEDNLSLLDRMTPKLMRKYHKKGIFTIRQLSHVYRPRRNRKKAKRQLRHSLELQALAIRTGKIHVEQLPELPRGPVELVVDLEGVPDRGEFYLAGLLVCRGEATEYESFWADDVAGEAAMWSALVERLEALPDAPLYHYGSYEKKAFATLARRHGKGSGLVDRLVNVASSVYGKVYFPVRSNGLKVLGRFLDAVWSDSQASGLQSLAWRHRWEVTRDDRFMQSLLQYNREDCLAVRLLVARLDRLRLDAATDPTVEFASRPKRHATETGQQVHGQFERILQSAQIAFAGRRIHIREKDSGGAEAGEQSQRTRNQAFRRMVPNTSRTVLVQPRQRCPKHDVALVPCPNKPAESTSIDLVFTKNGCRKTVTRYVGVKSRCPTCGNIYNPDSFRRGSNSYLFGHGFQVWAVYQRVILRLPYAIIAQVMEHLFRVGVGITSIVEFQGNLAGYYSGTEAALLQAILKSGFVHVDETRISIQGVDHYVWVFTDGQHVVFRMTETREADIVREVLAGYKGVLVSDFYPGYDGVPCRQQKCLVHLVRDINDDLWKAPFDKELEVFAIEVQSLLVPILAAVDRYGLKAWHLRRFLKEVQRFYDRNITGKEYTSEAVQTYQKRFDRYQDSLFTFLTQDGIPWNNNMAERAIRQLAVQRKISGSFYKRVAGHYLVLLAIAQTCRFQGKSFLKFLLSKETDVDCFRKTRPIRYSHVIPRRGDGTPEGEGRAGATGDREGEKAGNGEPD